MVINGSRCSILSTLDNGRKSVVRIMTPCAILKKKGMQPLSIQDSVLTGLQWLQLAALAYSSLAVAGEAVLARRSSDYEQRFLCHH
jgi:hypothetical protein